MSGINLSKPCGMTNSDCLLESHGNLSSSFLLLLLSLHFGCLCLAIILISHTLNSNLLKVCRVSLLPPAPSHLPPSAAYIIPKKNTALPLQAYCVYISLLFSSPCLACWFNQFDQMTFLAAEKRKPRVS